MITVFNRKQVAVSFSMKEQSEIRNKLASNGVNYSLKTINWRSSSPLASERARTGTFGENLEQEYQYIFYVKKQDYDKAKAVINGNLRK